MKLPTSFENLVDRSQSTNLYPKLVAQLNKDLRLANQDLQFDLEVLPTSLKYMLHELIFDLIQNHFREYLNLLYVVDVSEKKVRELDTSEPDKLAEQVTFLVLQRIWLKVWYKYTGL